MKKLISLFLIIIFSLSMGICLTGCKPPYYYSYEGMHEKVEKIEIINVDYEKDGSDLDEWNIELLKTLENDEMDILLKELSKIKFKYPFAPPSSSYGTCIKFYYKNGELEILSRVGTNFFTSSGQMNGGYNRTCSQKSFDNLIAKVYP